MNLVNEINTREYVAVLKQLVEEGQQVSMTVVGTSMEPFLKDQQDAICFQRPRRKLRPGDMVFYQRKNGQYVMHRICKKKQEDLYLAGDHQSVLEGPVKERQIFAVVTSVQKNGKWINEKHPVWRFYADIWRHLLPVRHILLKTGRVWKRVKTGV